MTVTLRDLTNDTFRECIGLKVAPGQENYVASNMYSLAEAQADGVSNPRAIYADEQMVGFIMYDFEPKESLGYITRLMVDEKFQRKGYGRAAMQQAIDLFKANPDCTEIYTSIHPENIGAQALYVSLGFVLTGEMEDGEVVLRMKVNQDSGWPRFAHLRYDRRRSGRAAPPHTIRGSLLGTGDLPQDDLHVKRGRGHAPSIRRDSETRDLALVLAQAHVSPSGEGIPQDDVAASVSSSNDIVRHELLRESVRVFADPPHVNQLLLDQPTELRDVFG